MSDYACDRKRSHSRDPHPRDRERGRSPAALRKAGGSYTAALRAPGGAYHQRNQASGHSQHNIQLNRQITASGSAHELCALIEKDIARFNQVNVATAFRKLLMLPPRGAPRGVVEQAMEALEREALKSMELFWPHHVCNMLHMMAKKRYRPASAELIPALGERLRAVAKTSEGQDVCLSMWAFATMGERPSAELVGALERRLIEVCKTDVNSQNVANVLWGYATMGERPGPGVVEALEGSVRKLAGEFKPQEMANTMWAYAVLGERPGAGVFAALETRLLAVIGEINTQDIANILWAYAKLGERPGAGVLGALEGRVQAVAWECTPQGIANILWAYATMGERPSVGVVKALEARMCFVAGKEGNASITPQNMTNTLWAYAKLGKMPGEVLWNILENGLRTLARDMSPQNIANTMWAYATLGEMPGEGLTAALEQRLRAVAGKSIAMDIANILWAYATMGQLPGKGLLEVMEARLQASAGESNNQDIANALWAYASLGQTPGRGLMGALVKRLRLVAEFCTPQDTANMLWASCCFASVLPEALIDVAGVLGERVHRVADSSLFEFQHCLQLHQVFLTCSLDEGLRERIPASMQRLGERMGSECRAAFIKGGAPITESLLQQDVSLALRGMGLAVQEEWRCLASAYSIDARVHLSAEQQGAKAAQGWVVEVDGPAHFLSCKTPTGRTMMKRRHLELLGYTVVSVPHWEWRELAGDRREQRASEGHAGVSDAELVKRAREDYLRSKLQRKASDLAGEWGSGPTHDRSAVDGCVFPSKKRKKMADDAGEQLPAGWTAHWSKTRDRCWFVPCRSRMCIHADLRAGVCPSVGAQTLIDLDGLPHACVCMYKYLYVCIWTHAHIDHLHRPFYRNKATGETVWKLPKNDGAH